VLRPFYQLLIKIANRALASQARQRGHNPFNDEVLGRHLRGARRHPDNVVRTRGSNPVEDRSAFAWAFGVPNSGPSYGETAFA
jgi:hypothetical protein